MPPATPARISLPDRYRVVRHLASGGMAAVWEAHDELLDRDVAVKILAPHLGEDERARRRFQREARAAAGLSSHPHVVTIYDVGEHASRVFMVMEIMRGGTLGDRLKSGRTIPSGLAVRWMREAAEALDTAHDAGVVHRDIKPGNLLLDGNDRLAVADFGIARVAWEDQLTLTGQVLGTAAYISPEQAMGEPATAASDRYSLAIVAYELLTGSRPFEGAHFAAQARAHVEDPPPPASTRAPELSKGVDAVLEKALAKEPSDRFASSAAFADSLDRALAAPETAKTRRLARFGRGAAAAGAAADLGGAAGRGDDAGELRDPPGQAGNGADERGGRSTRPGAAGDAAAAGLGAQAARGGPAADRGAQAAQGGPAADRGAPATRDGDLAGRGAADHWGWDDRERAGGIVPPGRGGRAAAAASPRRRGSAALLAGVCALLLIAVAGTVVLATRGSGSGSGQQAQTDAPKPTATAKAHHTATPAKTATATPTAAATATPTATPTTVSTGGSNIAQARSLQLAGFSARQAGDYSTALAKAKAALAACGDAHQLDPCGFALYEEGVALNRGGDPADAIPILQQRLAEYGDDSSGSVSKELKDAQKSASGGGKSGGPKGRGKSDGGD